MIVLFILLTLLFIGVFCALTWLLAPIIIVVKSYVLRLRVKIKARIIYKKLRRIKHEK